MKKGTLLRRKEVPGAIHSTASVAPTTFGELTPNLDVSFALLCDGLIVADEIIRRGKENTLQIKAKKVERINDLVADVVSWLDYNGSPFGTILLSFFVSLDGQVPEIYSMDPDIIEVGEHYEVSVPLPAVQDRETLSVSVDLFLMSWCLKQMEVQYRIE